MTAEQNLNITLGKPTTVVEFDDSIKYGDLKITVGIYNTSDYIFSDFEFGMSNTLRVLGLSGTVDLMKVIKQPADKRCEFQYVLDLTGCGYKGSTMVDFVKMLFNLYIDYAGRESRQQVGCVPTES